MHSPHTDKKENTSSSENITIKQTDELINFPQDVKWEYRNFNNWSHEIRIDQVPCCIPESVEQVLAVVNWAWQQNYKVRPVGQSHNWSPLILNAKQDAPQNIMLMDLQPHFAQVTIEQSSPASIVTAQTGVLMEALMTQMEAHGLGFTATPAPGDLTLGGVLAIGGHGTAINARGEDNEPGHTYGSLSNAILSLSAVVWDKERQQYILKVFKRTELSCAPLLTHLGSALILEVQLQAGKNQHLRCESITDISAAELFAFSQDKENNPQTVSHFLDKSGRVEVILFPFTPKPWLKVWSIAPEKPDSSVEVTEPYNYPFSDNISDLVSGILEACLDVEPALTPILGQFQYFYTDLLLSTSRKDIWGWSKNLLLYVKPTTLRVTANGYAILTRRADIQRVLSVFYTQWRTLLGEFAVDGEFPINGPIEVRVTGLDTSSEVIDKNAVAPGLSPLRPRPDKPEWDVAVWLDILTFPITQYAHQFLRKFEQWLFKEFNGTYAAARVEWSKGWAYSENAAWEDEDIIKNNIPASFNEGQPVDNNWTAVISLLNTYDPHHIFRSPLLEKLLSVDSQ
ncbi:FAD-binding protein [Xenorhabdus sp. DI]|uniref:cholesterol oxidase substrate-binding domain-containing protein n=1 Tax=Xenorhabdus doucetiae TaxID=351671 RepID=UPI001985D8EC|nr:MULTISPECIES: cholesterol oxidase substrate-binding domain-containing protein [unclassified Xenorhabdus]MBD2785090.1 FAD-binding protein [Xenorhabdus sp. 3]MBD2787553.1 FAD-binding protein [Xenorhabdus sp. DI]